MLMFIFESYLGYVVATMALNYRLKTLREYVTAKETRFETTLTILMVNMTIFTTLFHWIIHFHWFTSIFWGYILALMTLMLHNNNEPYKVYLFLDYMVRYSALYLIVYPIGSALILPLTWLWRFGEMTWLNGLGGLGRSPSLWTNSFTIGKIWGHLRPCC